jgi:serine/threonine-protein kinase
VAFKEIQPQLAGDTHSRQRFVREARVTGRLEHPGIVPVYGLGCRPNGQPFYAMRFIQGDSLKEAALAFHVGRVVPSERGATFRKLLRRFGDACNAVAFAHSKGVLHRDLKPANILLGPFGETLVVDWGLAKEVGDSADPTGANGATTAFVSDGGDRTGTGEAAGTPAYMSPEQAAGRWEEVGPSSDVYSLGATLYFLLTGKPAFGGDLLDVLRQVQAGQFPRPREVRPAVSKALEAVCVKAMALRPADRYSTALALAEDVERWLADEPVTAHREPWTKRAARWARRHRTIVSSLAVLVVTGVTALAVSAVQISKARDKAEFRFGQARAAVDDYLLQVEEDEALQTAPLQPYRQKLLQRALRYYQDFLSERADDPSLRGAYAQAHLREASIEHALGNRAAALAGYKRALPMYQQLASAHPESVVFAFELARGYHRMGRLFSSGIETRADALDAYRQALSVLEPLTRSHPEHTDSRRLLAKVYNSIGDWHKSENAVRAAEYCHVALAQRQIVAAALPDVAGVMRELSESYANCGVLETEARDLKSALGSYDKAIGVLGSAEAAPATAREVLGQKAHYLHDLGLVKRLLGSADGALDSLTAALSARERLVYTLQPETFANLARTYNDLADLQRSLGKKEEARKLLLHAHELRTQLITFNPGNTRHIFEVVESCHNLGQLVSDLGDGPGALKYYELGRAYVESLPDDQRRTGDFANLDAWNHYAVGLLHRKQKKPAEALRAFQAAREIREELVRQQPASTQYVSDLANTQMMIGNTLTEANSNQEALTYTTRAVSLMRQLYEKSKDDLTRAGDYGVALHNLGTLQARLGLYKEAAGTLDQAVALQRAAVQKAPRVGRYSLALGAHYKKLGEVKRRLGDADGASAAAQERGRLKPDDPAQLFDVACDLAQCVPLAGAGLAAGDPQILTEQARYADLAMASLSRAVEKGFRSAEQLKLPALDPLRSRADFQKIQRQPAEALGIMTGAIVEYDGVVGDFQGDATMGFWGWPLGGERQAEQACRAALNIRKRFAHMAQAGNRRLAAFSCGLGVAYGPAIAGRIGTPDQYKLGVFGPVVNLAARLESLTKRLGVPILIDRATSDAIPESVEFVRRRRVCTMRPAGMTRAVEIHELLPPVVEPGALSEGHRLSYEAALEAFRAGCWADAQNRLKYLLRIQDGPSVFLKAQMDRFPDGPQSGWDGVICCDTK